MNKYYIPEIDIKTIRNHPEILAKLYKVYDNSQENKQIIISTDGYYQIKKDNLIKYKIINKGSFIKENFIDKLTLIGMNLYYKEIGEEYSIPYEQANINLEIVKFYPKKLDTSSVSSNHTTYLVIEKNKNKNKIIDLYFLSKKHIQEDDYFFSKDMSLFIETLNV